MMLKPNEVTKFVNELRGAFRELIADRTDAQTVTQETGKTARLYLRLLAEEERFKPEETPNDET